MRTSALEGDTQTRHREALMEMVKLEIRDMLFETDPATAVAKRHKRSKTVASKDLANKCCNMNRWICYGVYLAGRAW